ncbi:site-specific DNA-methyltransferase [candidate division KSB1 bacterium]|nr:site-specific DNA-methyltransferase [candidate division KSB1 bacterium]
MIDIRHCDNLELMAEIQDNTIDLIYCDILYGTGKDFGDYKDLNPIRSEIENHYIPRIKEMHRILKPTGSIYLQMDTRINHWIRILMDDIFGYDNFRNEIVWFYKNASRGKNNYANSHDIILFYSKTNTFIFNRNDILIPFESKMTEWRYTKGGQKGKEMPKGKTPDNVFCLNSLNSMSKELKGYATQKPKALIERIIKASSNEGDLVADFYGGSFTTAEVCKDLNRNFIGCDIEKRAVEIGRKRVMFEGI